MHSTTVPIFKYPSCPHPLPSKLTNFQPRVNIYALPLKKMSFLDGRGFKISASGNSSASGDDSLGGYRTLREYMGKGGENLGDELVVLFSHLEYACKRIAALVASPLNSSLGKNISASAESIERDKPEPLDIVAPFITSQLQCWRHGSMTLNIAGISNDLVKIAQKQLVWASRLWSMIKSCPNCVGSQVGRSKADPRALEQL